MKSNASSHAPANFGLWTLDWNDYVPRMALVRILVDGYSLLHKWPELAAGAARHSETAREALVETLTQYQDVCGTPVTVFLTARARGAAGRKIIPAARWKFCFPAAARRRMI